MKENNFKNIEQLRYRIVLELRKISNQSKGDEGTIESYFVACIVDYVVGNSLQNAFESYLDNNIICVIFYFSLIIGLAFLFWIVSRLYCYIVSRISKNKKISGMAEITDLNYIKANIDEFDNTACNCLLICKNYIKAYKKENDDTLKQFYYNEIIHYFEKATFIFNIILLHNDVYIANINKMEFDPIRPYRVDSFINISNSIIDFLLNKSDGKNVSNELNNDIIKLNEQVKEFKRQWNP